MGMELPPQDPPSGGVGGGISMGGGNITKKNKLKILIYLYII